MNETNMERIDIKGIVAGVEDEARSLVRGSEEDLVRVNNLVTAVKGVETKERATKIVEDAIRDSGADDTYTLAA